MPFQQIIVSDYGTTNPPQPSNGYTTATHTITLSGMCPVGDTRENPTVAHVASHPNYQDWQWILHIQMDGTASFVVRAPDEYDGEADFGWNIGHPSGVRFITPARLEAWKAQREPLPPPAPLEDAAPSVWDHISREEEDT